MKNLLLLALGAAAVMSCKTQVGSDLDESNDNLISLSTGSASRASNQGIRAGLFEDEDQIGVVAVFEDASNPNTPGWDAPAAGPGTPTTGVYFDNKPAQRVSDGPTGTPTYSIFGWGPAAEGGTAHNQYYPSGKKEIYIYAYYPYSTTDYVSPTTGVGPKLNVTLTDGEIKNISATPETDANKVQADVLYYISGNDGTTPPSLEKYKSDSRMGTMTFEHALAQLTFKIKRPLNAKEGKVTKLVFKTAKTAALDLATGVFDFTNTTDFKDAVYTITPADPNDWVLAEDDGNPGFGTDILGGTPLMILPLDDTNAKLGELVLEVDFAQSGATAPETKTISVPLSGLTNALKAGHLSTYIISVTLHDIKLEASITPWGTGGSDNDLEAE